MNRLKFSSGVEMTEMKSVSPTGVGRMKSKAISIGGYASILEKMKIQKWQHCLNLNFYGLNKSLEYLLISIGVSLNIKTSSLEFKQSDFQFSSVQSLTRV